MWVLHEFVSSNSNKVKCHAYDFDFCVQTQTCGILDLNQEHMQKPLADRQETAMAYAQALLDVYGMMRTVAN